MENIELCPEGQYHVNGELCELCKLKNTEIFKFKSEETIDEYAKRKKIGKYEKDRNKFLYDYLSNEYQE